MKHWFLTTILGMQALKITSFNNTIAVYTTITVYTWDEV